MSIKFFNIDKFKLIIIILIMILNCSDKEILVKLFNYYSFLMAQRETGQIRFNKLPSEREGIYDYFFRKMIKVLGLNGKPKVLGDEEFLNLSKEPLCHGFNKFEYGRSFLCDNTYFPGTGHQSGFFSTPDFKEAIAYTSKFNDKEEDNPEKVLEFKINGENGITDDELKLFIEAFDKNCPNIVIEPYASKVRALREFTDTIKISSIKEEFTNAIKSDSLLAAYLGFDYLKIVYNKSDAYFVILNRAAIIVSEKTIKSFKVNAIKEKAKEENEKSFN